MMLYIITDCEQSLIFFWDTIECEHERKTKARARGERPSREKHGRSPSKAPISPPFLLLICIILFFARRVWLLSKKDDRSRSSIIIFIGYHENILKGLECH